MTEQETREKICEIIAPYVSAWGDDTAIANALIAAGYGDVRYVVKDVLNKVFRYVEEARLECEFQDKDGKWFMDESEFMCEFTLGKLQELYREYGIEMFTGSEQTNNKKEVCGDGD